MSKRGRSPRVDLGLNLSPAAELLESSSSEMRSVEGSSSSISSVSWDEERPGETRRAMLLVGCPRCLMYFMLSQVDPKCPKCKSTVLLDFLNHHTHNSASTTNKTNN